MKLNLQADQKKIRRYICDRVRDYPDYTNLGPGDDNDPIALMTVGFYAMQVGYVSVVFDTRPNAGPNRGFDGEWTLWLYEDTMLDLPKWGDAYDAIEKGKTVYVTRHTGEIVALTDAVDANRINAIFGEMITQLLIELRDDGTLSKLPLAPNAYMVVEEFNDYYFWPQPGKPAWPDAKTQAIIQKIGCIER